MQAQFSGHNFHALFTDGCLRFSSAEKILARLASYQLEYGLLHHIRRPITDGNPWITLDSCEELVAGDEVELRNEYQNGRSNFPPTHICRILERRENEIQVEPPVPQTPALRTEAGLFLAKRHIAVIAHWKLDEQQDLKRQEIWKLSGDCPQVSVSLVFRMKAEHAEVKFSVTRKYKAAFTVWNERLTFDSLPPLLEVYRKNRQVDTILFNRRYNVDRQGGYWAYEDGQGVYVHLWRHQCHILGYRV
jgi:hypothetical protein